VDFLKTMQDERREWVARNFPNSIDPENPGVDSMLGVIEELGELTHAHLKQAQGIRGTVEEHEANKKDSIGDMTIYLLGVAEHGSFMLGDVVEDVPFGTVTTGILNDEMLLFKLARIVGRLAVMQTNPSGHSHGRSKSCAYVVHLLALYCEAHAWDYEAEVQAVWDRVKQRDWVADPHSGGEKQNFGVGPVPGHPTS
jgi:hypothetical protein